MDDDAVRVVMANGCFDILHAGHVAHLKAAREMGDFLVVALTVDASVGKGEGRPVFTWSERAACLRELRCVGAVVPARSALQAIRSHRPALFVKGLDYRAGGWTEDVPGACAELGIELRFTDTAKLSSSVAIRKAAQCERA